MVRITNYMQIELNAKALKRIGRIWGWAPGSYEGKCIDCSGPILGDKRAVQCFVCAVVRLKSEATRSDEVSAADQSASLTHKSTSGGREDE